MTPSPGRESISLGSPRSAAGTASQGSRSSGRSLAAKRGRTATSICSTSFGREHGSAGTSNISRTNSRRSSGGRWTWFHGAGYTRCSALRHLRTRRPSMQRDLLFVGEMIDAAEHAIALVDDRPVEEHRTRPPQQRCSPVESDGPRRGRELRIRTTTSPLSRRPVAGADPAPQSDRARLLVGRRGDPSHDGERTAAAACRFASAHTPRTRGRCEPNPGSRLIDAHRRAPAPIPGLLSSPPFPARSSGRAAGNHGGASPGPWVRDAPEWGLRDRLTPGSG